MEDETIKTQIAQLYVGLIGRAPDQSGLEFWANGYQNNLDKGLSESAALRIMAQQMFDSPGARTYYPEGSGDRTIISRFYQNVLGRQGDEQGIAFWTDALERAANTGDVLVEMIEAVTGYSGDDPAGKTSQALFNNKSAVAVYYGAEVSQPGEPAIGESTALLEAVTVETDVSDDAAVGAFVSNVTAEDLNRTFTLDEAGAEITGEAIAGASPRSVRPGSGDDVFVAPSGTLEGSAIDGAHGRDVLRVPSLDTELAPRRVDDVEVIELTGRGGGRTNGSTGCPGYERGRGDLVGCQSRRRYWSGKHPERRHCWSARQS